jgi:hypothetical protein
MANYEIKIRISSEEVFQMLARYAPWELVDVEELPPNPLPKAPPAVKALANHLKRLNAVKFDSVAKVRKVRALGNFDMTKGMNAAVMHTLSDGRDHSTAELIKAIQKHGFKKASINSLLARLLEFGFIQRVSVGRWVDARRGVGNKGRQENNTDALSNPQEAS